MSMKKVLRTLILTCFALAVSFAAMAQQEVKGVVTDESGEPLPGVTVVIAGTSSGVITDINGNYSIQVESGATLIFTFVGMVPQQVDVGSNSTIDISMKTDAIGLEEVQVVGYGQQKKVTITGAISSMDTEELLKSPTTSVGNALAGRITGVTSVQSSGQPGADDPELYIRGQGTFGDASPIFIVDGVEREFSQLDPNEIESVTVLKDASATAVYGIRGANGVIIVTTKRGQRGKMNIQASYSRGIVSLHGRRSAPGSAPFRGLFDRFGCARPYR